MIRHNGRITITRFRTVPWQEIESCVRPVFDVEQLWIRIAGHPIRIFCAPVEKPSLYLCSGPFWMAEQTSVDALYADLGIPRSHRDGTNVVCAHMIEMD